MRGPYPFRFMAIALLSVLVSRGEPLAAEIAATGSVPEITIAVRSDARPFAWRNNDTGQHLGYLWDVCTEAVHRAGYRFHTKEIGTGERKKFLEQGTPEYDLLCDPTTITLRRMQNFTDTGQASALGFTSIIFVANGSFVRPVNSANRPEVWGTLPVDVAEDMSCEDLIGWLEDENWLADARWKPPSWDQISAKKDSGANPNNDGKGKLNWRERLERRFDITLKFKKNDNEGKPKRFEIYGYVAGSTIGDAIEASIKQTAKNGMITCLKPFREHSQAAEAFCSGRLDRYFGDVEIIKAAIEEQKQHDKVCEADLSGTNAGSYEPYALVVSSQNCRELPERLNLALYGMFEDGTMRRIFSGHFPDTQMSQHLSTLFRINKIPAGTNGSDHPPPVEDGVCTPM